jgi:serine-type D-Ala-D-Ala carboxypeptidase/endopeptidase (penicillin-binding protein 4)
VTLPSSLRALLPAALLASACSAPPSRGPVPAADPLAAALDSIFADTAFARARWGVLIRSAGTGRDLYRRDAEKLFIPASNQKLVTAAVALEALGPDYRFATSIEAAGPIEGGVLRGDLVVRGSGDPSISTAFGGAKAILRAWADSLRARGVTRVAGRLVGNDDALDDVPLGRGWAWDDLDAAYSAEVGALELNEGFVAVRARAGAAGGAPAIVWLDPPTGYLPVENRATTVGAGTPSRLEAVRAANGPGIIVSGVVAADTPVVETAVAVRDNTRFFLHVLAETLREAGIALEGDGMDADSLSSAPAPDTPLFVHRSPPLSTVLPVFLKPSQNQIGELLLKTLGRELRGSGAATAGIVVVDSAVRAWGLPPDALRPADGSGLSRYDLVAPELLVGVLEHMERSPNAALFRESLPIAGQDGTLAARMRGTPLAGNLRAKTGTLTGVRSLSGYLTTARGERIVFSILANGHTRRAADVDRVVEAALLRVFRDR